MPYELCLIRLYWLNSHWANLQLSGLGHRVVATTCQNVNGYTGKAETGENSASWGAVGQPCLYLDHAASASHFHEIPIADAPLSGIIRMDFKALLIEKVINSAAASGLCSGMVCLQASPGRQPDREFAINDLSGVTVADHLEESPSIFKFLLMQARRPGMVTGRHRPLVFSILDAVPVQARINGTQ